MNVAFALEETPELTIQVLASSVERSSFCVSTMLRREQTQRVTARWDNVVHAIPRQAARPGLSIWSHAHASELAKQVDQQ
eukprot:255825-Chlamydomonas_euryale.AAC.1